MINGDETDGDFALVEHPLGPTALGAPLHRHANEDRLCQKHGLTFRID